MVKGLASQQLLVPLPETVEPDGRLRNEKGPKFIGFGAF
jgi:hypothetical protein